MKKIFILSFVGIASILFSAYRNTEKQMDDLFKLMGITKTEANILLRENLLYTSLNTPSVTKLKNIVAGKRPAMVQEIGNYMKDYFKKTEVSVAYKEYRESIMPGKQEGIDVKARIEEIKRDIKNTELDKKAASADMKKLYDETIIMLQKQLEILQNPKHPDYILYAGINTLTADQQEEINKQRIEFSKRYPESLEQYLKLKLNEFLELTDDIDFDAKLIQQNGKWKFENPAYEAKDYNWKKCFRAGKETVETARNFTKDWLKELK